MQLLSVVEGEGRAYQSISTPETDSQVRERRLLRIAAISSWSLFMDAHFPSLS
jgi:hypothetical protein